MNLTTQTSRAATWGAAVSAAISVLLATSLRAAPASRFVECETFTDYGGWVVDPHSMKRMGASYLMAHGCGTPVRDATRTVNFAEARRYTVHVRTGDWEQEAGQYRDMADDTEAIRDYGLLSIFSNWSFIKNHSARRIDAHGRAEAGRIPFRRVFGRQRVLPFQGHRPFPPLAEAASDDAACPRRD